MHFPIIYLHIPKTAGTSFRLSAEQYFGPEQVLNDYGEKSPSTSEDILASIYSNSDTEQLRSAGTSKCLLTGHFALEKYREVFPDSPVVTFFRNPVDRIISEYMHFSTHYGFDRSLTEFISRPHFQNRQSRALSGISLSELSFFGLTEHYAASLDLFNRKFATNLPMARLNSGGYGGVPRDLVSEEDIAQIEALNKLDLELYDSAVKAFDEQSTEVLVPMTTPRRYCGMVGGINESGLFGWIVDRESVDPAEIEIAVNGKVKHRMLANKHRDDLRRKGYHISGACGFLVSLRRLGRVHPGDRISVITADGKFELANGPIIVGN